MTTVLLQLLLIAVWCAQSTVALLELPAEVISLMGTVLDAAIVTEARTLTPQDALVSLSFNSIQASWEGFSEGDRFAQTVYGRKDQQCFAVFRGRNQATDAWLDDDFAVDLQPLDIPGIYRSTTNGQCQGQATIGQANFPEYWTSFAAGMSDCMQSCAIRFNGEPCDLVLGGYGHGGMIASLLALELADLDPYLITFGGYPSVIASEDCVGFNTDRYYKIINTKPLQLSLAGIQEFGICFDAIPFTDSPFVHFGTYIGLGGMRFDGTALMGQFIAFEENPERTSLCNDYQTLAAYDANFVFMDPATDVTIEGLGREQFCESDFDCRTMDECRTGNGLSTKRCFEAPLPPPVTEEPTPNPTPSPTPEPTPSPTPNPTPSPTPVPTPFPTPEPTPKPILVLPPNLGPFSLPPQFSNLPTDPPIDPPVTPPTDSPVKPPTDPPVKLPTTVPTTSPVKAVAPVVTPSTMAPEPTVAPVLAPVVMEPKDDGGSLESTPAPTATTLHNYFFRCTIVWTGITEKLDRFEIIEWESATADYLDGEILISTLDWENDLTELQVNANVDGQRLVSGGDFSSVSVQGVNGGQRQRHLQNQALEIIFDAKVSFSYPETVDDDFYEIFIGLIKNAFSDSKSLNLYQTLLEGRITDSSFHDGDIILLQIVDTINDPITADSAGGLTDNVVFLLIIVCSMMGASVAVSLAIYCALQPKKDKIVVGKNVFEAAVPPSATMETHKTHMLTSEIVVDRNMDDGISTLGEPIFSVNSFPRDEDTASLVRDEYKKSYLDRTFDDVESKLETSLRGRSPSEDCERSSFSKMGGKSVLTDNESFEEVFMEGAGSEVCFDVIAPPGKLGMVIVLSELGEPSVHAIKETSILVEQVRVGDKLISIDGIDCCSKTAEQVSKLISFKANQEARKMVFLRTTQLGNPTRR